MDYLGGRAIRTPIYLVIRGNQHPAHRGVQYVVPSGLFTDIIYIHNVGSHTLPHFDV